MNLLVFFIWVVLFLGKWSGLIKIRLGICLKGSISILSSDLRKMVYTEIPKFIFMQQLVQYFNLTTQKMDEESFSSNLHTPNHRLLDDQGYEDFLSGNFFPCELDQELSEDPPQNHVVEELGVQEGNCFMEKDNHSDSQNTGQVESCPISQMGQTGKNIRNPEKKDKKIKKQVKKKPTKKPDRSKGERKGNKRKRDQNMCKKYYAVAFNVLKNLKLEQIATHFKQKIYRQDFFIIILKIAESHKILAQFQKQYSILINQMKEEIQMEKKMSRQKKKKNMDLLQGINRSLASVELYIQGDYQKARLQLFDVRKLRNRNFVENSKKFIDQIQSQITMMTLESKI